ncbi:MAG TPA: malate dehydrogenase [Methanothermococcus okinawensis]|uniref:Malate dehydrogenase n=1 Tax=Methanothermococcus okinawensis TaxID=155863 RepID=A0A832ZBV1_9EURY|nr:malate dehydrogenase [Methanococcaceae archaeon]HIP84566.1 malate dehydrogenase [Methanothermococcus okinawensis]HIP90814.1 malate dehydrogenase [Methanothermococcus okinawensis]
MKVAVIGASGRIGSTVSFLLAREPSIKHIVLIAREKSLKKLEGIRMDMYDALAAEARDAEIEIYSDREIPDAVDSSEITVISAGVPRRDNMSRLDLAKINAKIIKNYVKDISKTCDTKLFIVTNPVDIMTQKALFESGYDRSQVFGLGTHLDSMRFKVAVAKYFGVHIGEVRTRIIGEHGDTMVPLLSATAIGGIPINRMPGYENFPYREIVELVKSRGKEIIRLKGGSEYGPASAVVNVIKTIINDDKRVLTLSTYLNGEIDGIRGVCIGVPVKLGRRGVEEIVPIKICPQELETFRRSVQVLKACWEDIKDI